MGVARGYQGARKFAVILAFDVPVNREARDLAESMGIRIFTADIIYHLFDQFQAYLKYVRHRSPSLYTTTKQSLSVCALLRMPLPVRCTCLFLNLLSAHSQRCG